jgi:hypothetical protein
MSRYGYDYSLAPSPSTGWRTRFATVLTVGAIAAISAISGAAVALNLLAPARTTAESPVIVTTHALPARVPVAQTVTPAPPQPANAGAAVAQSRPAAAAQPAAQPAAAAAPQPAPAAAVAAVEEPAARVPERELTFTQGYARRRAAQAAADATPGVKTEKTAVARVEQQSEVGRAAKTKPRAIARANAPQEQQRVAEAPERFDFARHQALAFGDPRDPQPSRRPPPQGGLFGNSPGGFFGGLF